MRVKVKCKKHSDYIRAVSIVGMYGGEILLEDKKRRFFVFDTDNFENLKNSNKVPFVYLLIMDIEISEDVEFDSDFVERSILKRKPR